MLERLTKVTTGSFPFSSLRMGREQHVLGFSNHSPHHFDIQSTTRKSHCHGYSRRLPALVVNHFDNQCSICLSPPKPKYNERFARPSTMVSLKCIYIYMLSSIVKEATTFEMELRGHKQATAHSHERTKNSNPSKNIIFATTQFEFESPN